MPTFEITPEMMREIIMDHSSNPRHFGAPSSEDGYTKVHASSANCIDDFDVYLKVKDGKIEDARFEGVACTISKSSTDILCDIIIGDDEATALRKIEEFKKMIREEHYDDEILGEAVAFKNTGKQAGRIHCATMGYDTVKDILTGEEK